MTNSKFHLESQEPHLNQTLEDFDVIRTGRCLRYTPLSGTSPQATLRFKHITAEFVYVELVLDRPSTGVTIEDFILEGSTFLEFALVDDQGNYILDDQGNYILAGQGQSGSIPVEKVSLTQDGQIYVLLLSRVGFGQFSVELAQNFAQDGQGQPFQALGPISLQLFPRPIPTITGPTQVSFTAVTLQVNFTEAVTGLTLVDFVVVDGTLTNLSGSGSSYTVELTVAIGQQFPQVVLPEYTCQNSEGEFNESSNIYAPIVAHVRPTPTVTPTQSSFPTTTTRFRIRWSESVSGYFEASQIQIINGTLTSLSEINSREFLAVVTATGDVTVTLTIAADQFTVPGFAANAAGSAQCQVDRTALVFTLTPSASLVNDAFTVLVEGSIAHEGLTRDDFVIENGIITDWFVDGDDGTLHISPVRYQDTYTITLRLPAARTRSISGVYNDPAGPIEIEFDHVGPVIQFQTPYRSGDAVVFPLLLNESATRVNSYDYPDATEAWEVIGPRVVHLTINPVAGKGVLRPVLPAGLFEDTIGNPSLETPGPEFAYDRVGPIVLMTLVPDGHLESRPTNKVIRRQRLWSDEPLSVPLAADRFILSPELRIIAIETIRDLLEYVITTESMTQSHVASIQIPQGAVQDQFGNLNTTSATVSWIFDRIAPTIGPWRSNDIPGGFLFEATLSEVCVISLGESAITLDGLTITSLELSSRNIRFSTQYTRSGVVGFQFREGVFKDLADNPSVASEFISRNADNQGPVITITSDQAPLTKLALITFTVQFNEPIAQNFAQQHIVLDNAVIDPVNHPGTKVQKDTDTRYTVVVKALAEGVVTLTIPAGAVQDLAGNPSVAASFGLTYSFQFNLQLSVAPGAYADRRLITVASTERTIDSETLTLEDLLLSLGAIEVDYTATTNVFDITLAPAQNTARVAIDAGTVLSEDGFSNRAVSLSTSYAPMTAVVTMVSMSSGAKLNEAITIDMTWNIKVTQFSLSQLQFGIRDVDNNVISGTGLAASWSGFETVVPGYRYRVRLTVTTMPTDRSRPLHVWHERMGLGTLDMSGRHVTNKGFTTIPFLRAFNVTITSPQAPVTETRIIEFVITFSKLLDAPLTISDIEIENAVVDPVAHPGTGFSETVSNLTYSVKVYASSAGAVVVRLPAGNAMSVDGEDNELTQLSVEWTGVGVFSLVSTLTPGEHSDQFLLTIGPAAGVTMDLSQITFATLNYNPVLAQLVELSPANFMVRVNKEAIRWNLGEFRTNITIDAGAYVSDDGRTNRDFSREITWADDVPLRLIAVTPSYTHPNAFVVRIHWPVFVTGFDETDLRVVLLDSNNIDRTNLGPTITWQSFNILVPGYVYEGTLVLDDYPNPVQTTLRVNYLQTSSNAETLFELPPAYFAGVSVPIRSRLSVTLSSTSAPETDTRRIAVRALFNKDLAADLIAADLTLTNCTLVTIRKISNREYFIDVDATVGGTVTVTIAEDTVASVDGDTNLAGTLSLTFVDESALQAELLFLPDKIDVYLLRIYVPAGRSKADLHPDYQDKVVAYPDFPFLTKTLLPDTNPAYVDFHLYVGVASRESSTDYALQFDCGAVIEEGFFTASGFITRSKSVSIRTGHAYVTRTLEVKGSITGNNNIYVDSTFTVRLQSNCKLTLNQVDALLDFYCSDLAPSARHLPTAWYSPGALKAADATVIDEGYIWDFEITVNRLDMPSRYLDRLAVETPRLAIPKPPASTSGSFPELWLGKLTFAGQSMISPDPDLDKVFAWGTGNPAFRTGLSTSKPFSQVDITISPTLNGDRMRRLILEFVDDAGTYQGSGFSGRIEWNGSSVTLLGDGHLTEINNDFVEQRTAPWFDNPRRIYRVNIPFLYASNQEEQISIQCTGINNWRIHGVHLAKLDTQNNFVPITPADDNQPSILAAETAHSYDCRKLTRGRYTVSALDTLTNFGDRALLQFSGSFTRSDEDRVWVKSWANYDPLGTPRDNNPFHGIMDLEIRATYSLSHWACSTPDCAWIPRQLLVATAFPFTYRLRSLHTIYAGVTTLPAMNVAFDTVFSKIRFTGPFVLRFIEQSNRHHLPSRIELDGLRSVHADLHLRFLHADARRLQQFILRNGPTAPESQSRITLPFSEYVGNPTGGLTLVEFTNHQLHQLLNLESTFFENMRSQVLALSIDELPTNVTVISRALNRNQGQPVPQATIDAIRARLQALGRPDAFIITAE